jgi:hypothetical protein
MIFRRKISQFDESKLIKISTLVMVLLGISAYVLAPFRLYGDSADYLVRMIQYDSFFIAHERPASIFIEWLPMLLIWMSIPMKMVILSLSMAEWLWFFACFMAFRFFFKSNIHAIALVLIYLFGIRWNYFNPVSELILAFPIFLLLQLILSKAESYSNTRLLILASFIVAFLVFSHPLYAAAIGFLLVWKWIESGYDRKIIWLSLSFAVIVAIRYFTLDSYDKNPLNKLVEEVSLQETIDKFTFLPHVKDLLKSYFGLILSLLIGIWILAKRKQYLLIALLLAFVFGYVALVIQKFGFLYPETYEPFERYLFILPLVVLTVLIPQLKQLNGMQIAILRLCLIVHFITLVNYSFEVQERYSIFNNAISNSYQFDECKVAYRKENYHLEFVSNRDNGHDWIQTSESLLLSSMRGRDSTKQVFIKEILPDDFYTNAGLDQFLIYPTGWTISSDTINDYYFNLPHSKWKIANTDSVQEFTLEEMKKVLFTTDDLSFGSYAKGTKVQIQIRLENKLGRPIFSGVRNGKSGISYKWYNPKTGAFLGGLFTSQLMADFYTTLNQKMMVVMPDEKGEYVLVPGWLSNKTRQFSPFTGNTRIHVEY